MAIQTDLKGDTREVRADPVETMQNAARMWAREILEERRASGQSAELFSGIGNNERAIVSALQREVPAAVARALEKQGPSGDGNWEEDRKERISAAREASRQALVAFHLESATRGIEFADLGRRTMNDLRRMSEDTNLLFVSFRMREEYARLQKQSSPTKDGK